MGQPFPDRATDVSLFLVTRQGHWGPIVDSHLAR